MENYAVEEILAIYTYDLITDARAIGAIADRKQCKQRKANTDMPSSCMHEHGV